MPNLAEIIQRGEALGNSLKSKYFSPIQLQQRTLRRYLIGDTIKFTDLERSEIVITGRTKHFLSICGEHLSVDNMNAAIQQLEQQLHIAIAEFTVIAVESDNYFAHHWFLGCHEMPDEPSGVVSLLDDALQEVNEDYAIERRSTLRKPELTLLPVSRFYEWQSLHGKMGGQNKFPRVMRGDAAQAWLAFAQQQNQASS